MAVNDKTPKQGSQVVASDAMIPPSVRRMYERRPYVARTEPPATHARLCRALDGENDWCLSYNGADILTMRFPAGLRPGLRAHSDGDFQSQPFIQQFQMWLDEDMDVPVEFSAPVEMWNMRPRRAGSGEAILGQVGRPLMYGVNGLYLPDWDLLVSWHGLPFTWEGDRIACEDGCYRARMTLRAGRRPWVVLIRPRYYSEHLGYATHAPWRFRPNPKAVTGWCSWEAYHSDICQQDIERTAKALRPLRDYGLEYMQLDDGYQNSTVPPAPGHDMTESWLNPNERFPGGHQAIVAAMRSGGFEPGIWTNCSFNNEQAAAESPYVLRHSDGTPIRGDWIQFVMDCTPETLARQVTPYYRAFRELGYTYVKSDALRHLIYDGLQEAVRLGLMDDQDARDRHRAYLKAAREGLGDETYYLSCWGVLTSSIGVCDAMRVATDANPSWGAYSMQLRETARWFFAQRVLFTVDPDHVCVRGRLEWARMMLSLVSLTGGLFMVSDKVEDYDPDRLALMKKTMPGLTTRAAETGPIDYASPACAHFSRDISPEEGSYLISHLDPDGDQVPFSSLWSVHFDACGRRWTVVQRAGVTPLASVDVPLSKLALDPDRRYAAWDFWTGAGCLIEDGVLRFGSLALGDTTVVALTDVTDGRPTLIGSDRHVSMDAVSVTCQSAADDRLTLDLSGFAGLEVEYVIWPGGLGGDVAEAAGCRAALRRDGGLLRLTVCFGGASARVTLT